MLLNVIAAAMLLNLGTMFSHVQINDQAFFNQPVITQVLSVEDEVPQECLDKVLEDAGNYWDIPVTQLRQEYEDGELTVTEIATETYQVERGGGSSVYISICTGHGA
ncbi:MAG: hypothetical protein H6581_21895 [Bacteroidia bacterium]|nr:hypothetical protein [Bacteroidia bacterium]